MSRVPIRILAGGMTGALVLLAGDAHPPQMSRAQAHDFGRFGETWPVIEPDLLQAIGQRLAHAQASGEIDRLNRTFSDRAQARVEHPPAVAGLAAATQNRTWVYDPSVAIDADVRDAKGALIATKGQRINPLDLVRLPRELVFVDGTSSDEMAWANARGNDTRVSIILVRGAPLERMRQMQRRIWFDQAGILTTRFGITHTPAYVRQQGRTLEVSEVALPRKGAVS
ncbi:MAG: type-F conjugative transfer system protein TraW [Pseudomonadota bacterium]